MWASRFIRQLESPRIRPRWLVESIEGTDMELGGTIRLSSHPTPGYNEVLAREGNRYSAGVLVVGEWTQSLSEMTLAIRPVVDLTYYLARGRLVVVRLGFDGWAIDDYEPIFHGHIQGFSRSGDSYTLTLRSIIASLVFPVTSDPDTTLFDVTSTVIATTAYTAGAATVNVATTTGAEKDTGGNYLIQIFPDVGDPFFLTATGITATTFTGCSATGILGTTVGNAALGAVVQFCAYYNANPTDVVRKVLTTTGAGTNGAFDTGPASWGIGIPDNLIDHDDIDLTERVTDPPGAGMIWAVYSTEDQSDGLTWLQRVLGPAGLVLCERQGLLTVRAASPSYDRPYGVHTLTDDDIVAIERQDAWSPESPIEFFQFFVIAANTSVLTGLEEGLDSLPSSVGRIVYLDYVSANATAWEESVRDRLGPWSTRLPETVEIRCLGLRFAKLAPCDSIVVLSRHYRPRTHDEVPSLMVLACEPNWWEGTVRIVAAIIPEDQAEH